MKYLTVAQDKVRQQAPGLPTAEWFDQPVGLRHAVPFSRDFSFDPQSLCGVDVNGWQLFLDLEFVGAHPAECRRCGQLLQRLGRG